jgi:hypothetical protein
MGHLMHDAARLSSAAAAVPDRKLAATDASPAEPREEPKPVAHGSAPGAGLRLFAVHAPEDAPMRWLGDAVGRLLANHPDHDRLLIVVDQL